MTKFIISFIIASLFSFSAMAATNEQSTSSENQGLSIKSVYVDFSRTHKAEYDGTLGIYFGLWGDGLYTRLQLNNNDGLDVLSFLAEYDQKRLWFFGETLYPIAVINVDIFDGYQGVSGKSASRLAQGLGLMLKLADSSSFTLAADTEFIVTEEIGTILDGKVVGWLRARARTTIALSTAFYLHLDAMYATGLTATATMFQYTGSLEFKISNRISFVGSVNWYDLFDPMRSNTVKGDEFAMSNKVDVRIRVKL